MSVLQESSAYIEQLFCIVSNFADVVSQFILQVKGLSISVIISPGHPEDPIGVAGVLIQTRAAALLLDHSDLHNATPTWSRADDADADADGETS